MSSTSIDMSGFIRHYFGMFLHPVNGFKKVLSHEKKLRFGMFAFLVTPLGYTLFYLMAWKAGGAPSSFKPWLAIPLEEYFKYDIFLTLPGYFISWIASAGVVQLLSRALGSHADYEDSLIVLGFGIGIASWSSMLHDLTDAFLGVTGIIDMRVYEQLLNEPSFWRYLLMGLYILYFAWFQVLYYVGFRQVHRLNGFRTAILSLSGMLVFQVTLLIFIR